MKVSEQVTGSNYMPEKQSPTHLSKVQIPLIKRVINFVWDLWLSSRAGMQAFNLRRINVTTKIVVIRFWSIVWSPIL